MATISINLGGAVFNYTVGAADIQRIMNVYDPSDSQTNAQTAQLIADGWVQSLVDQVRSIEIDTAKTMAERAVGTISITKV